MIFRASTYTKNILTIIIRIIKQFSEYTFVQTNALKIVMLMINYFKLN